MDGSVAVCWLSLRQTENFVLCVLLLKLDSADIIYIINILATNLCNDGHKTMTATNHDGHGVDK